MQRLLLQGAGLQNLRAYDFLPESSKTPRIPFCVFQGLNYANVLDENNKTLSDTKYKELGLIQEPKAYNVDYKTLTNPEIGNGFGFEFGEMKPLVDWFILWKEEISGKS